MDKKPLRDISGPSSIFLDLLRLTAAIIVFLVHAHSKWFPAEAHDGREPGDFSHAAVVVFFVLSGYVIAYTAFKKKRSRVEYAQARLSRLYSILIPGIIITAIVELIIFFVNHSYYLEFSRGNPLMRYSLTLGFLNEWWFFSAGPPINTPLWSLGFEFWYYVIFGFWIYKTNGLKGYILPILACLFIGPKVLLMMPIWLLGVWVFNVPKISLKPFTAFALIAFVFIIAYFYVCYAPPYPSIIGVSPLFWAGQFLTDYLLGLIIAFALWLLPSGSSKVNFASEKKIKIFREVADLTFPIYVLHMPLLFLYKAIFKFQVNNLQQFLLASLIVFIACSLIGYLLNRARPFWNTLFSNVLMKTSLLYKKFNFKKAA